MAYFPKPGLMVESRQNLDVGFCEPLFYGPELS